MLPLRNHEPDYVFGRGKLYFDQFNAAGVKTGERFLGNCPGFSLNVESEPFEHKSSTSGLSTTDLTLTVSVDFSAEITVDDMQLDNIGLFVGGNLATITQSNTPVVDESITPILSDREYQLGTTTSNPTGVRNVSSVTVESAEGHDAATRADSTAYSVGDFIVPATPNNRYYLVTVGGNSGGSPPTFPTDGSTVSDGDLTLRDMGPILRVVTTDYTVDAVSGRIYVVPGGGLATAIGHAAALASPVDLELYVGYTPASESRQRVTSGTAGSVSGALRYIADNANGSNRDLYIASCSAAPSGELAFITDADIQQFTLAIGVNTRDSNTAQIIIDGRNVG